MSRGVSLAACAASAALLAVGCGESERNASEPKATFAVEIVRARFPRKQAVAKDTRLELVVRNAGARVIPNVAVTLDSFYYTSDYPRLANDKRPVWIVNTGPGAVANPTVETEQVNPHSGGETAFTNTWALGRLAAGGRARFIWHVTPVKSGRHTVYYTIAAGLDGKAVAKLPGGGVPNGRLVARIAPLPPRTHVNPETGEVKPGPNPVSRSEVGAVP
ncbi:MAG TPA: hypothetical protein VFW38_04925 [Solirubrobacteraceae bacterium]|nr:hypothetical protein [Solirubrobacteraceae bacterium]